MHLCVFVWCNFFKPTFPPHRGGLYGLSWCSKLCRLMLLAIFPEPLLLCSCANYFVRAESFVRFSCPVLSRVETWLSAAVLTGVQRSQRGL